MLFAKELKARGHDVRIFVRKDRRSARERARNLYLAARYGDADWLRLSDVPVIDYTSLSDHSFGRDELVIAMCSRTSFDLMELGPAACIPVYHCHGAEIQNWDAMIEAWHLPTYKLAVCSRLARAMDEETGRPGYGVVPDGVDMTEYYPALSESARDSVGAGFRWSYAKDPDNIIRVFSELRRRMPGLPLVSFGDGRRPRRLKGVEYSRLPSVERGRTLYSRCLVWFLPSIQEGFGLPLLEAMACGCAVVATDSGGPTDLIKNGQNGFLAEVGYYGEIVRRIVQLLEDDELRGRFVREGRETAKRYSWEAAGAVLEERLLAIRDDDRASR